MKIWVLMASNKPEKSVQTILNFFPPAYYNPVLFVHQSEETRFRQSLQSAGLCGDVPIIFHKIQGTADFTPMGALRYRGLNVVQGLMGEEDIAFLSDDDYVRVRYSNGEKYPSGEWAFRSATKKPWIVRKRLASLAEEAKRRGMEFFTPGCNPKAHNSFRPNKPYREGWKWSGIVGVFKHSSNVFDKNFGLGADWDAMARLYQNSDGYAVLVDGSLAMIYGFAASDYRDENEAKGKQRRASLPVLQARYNGVVEFTTKRCSGVVDVKLTKRRT